MTIIGRGYWILIWYGILTIGVVGLLAALYWAKQTQGKNFDEILRAVGTITISIGMLLLLYGLDGGVGQVLLVVALLCFIAAFVVGRRNQPPQSARDPGDDDDAD